MTRLSLVITAICIALLAGVPGAHAQSRGLVIDDVGAASVKGRSFLLFKKLAEEKLGGKYAVTVSEGGALYTQDNEIAAEQLGAVQVSAPGIGVLAAAFPKVTVITLPYLLTTPEAIKAAVDDPTIGLFVHWVYGPHTCDGVVGTNHPLLLASNFSGRWPGLVPPEGPARGREVTGRSSSALSRWPSSRV